MIRNRHGKTRSNSEIINNGRDLAEKYGITVNKGNNINKGWAGQVIEKHLGLSINSSQNPNAGSWELKLIPLQYNSKGNLKLKETMAVTMINADNVMQKILKIVICLQN